MKQLHSNQHEPAKVADLDIPSKVLYAGEVWSQRVVRPTAVICERIIRRGLLLACRRQDYITCDRRHSLEDQS